jgi:hypothetical protein
MGDLLLPADLYPINPEGRRTNHTHKRQEDEVVGRGRDVFQELVQRYGNGHLVNRMSNSFPSMNLIPSANVKRGTCNVQHF